MPNIGIEKIIRNYQDQQEEMAKALSSIANPIPDTDAKFDPMRGIREATRKHTEDIQKLTKPLRLATATLQHQMEPTRDLMHRFLVGLQDTKEQYRQAQAYLFDEGWYLGGDMPLPNYGALAEMVRDDRHMDIEEAMCLWSRRQIKEIATEVSKVFPDRVDLVGAAIEAHRNGGYALSIPTLFAQADGIAKEVIGNCLFRGNPVRALEDKLSEFDRFPLSDFSEILLDPLRTKSCFYTCSTRQTLKSGHTLANRSAVLHGSQLDYASERNSLRAIVLVGYLVGVRTTLNSHSEYVDGLLAAIDDAANQE